MAAIILFVCSLIQGMSGFGFTLLGLPLLALIWDVKYTVIFLVIQAFLLNIVTIIRLKKHFDMKMMGKILLISVICTPIGVNLLQWLSSKTLLLFASLMLLALYILPTNRLKIQVPDSLAIVLAGASSGILHASVGLSGPPVMMYLSSKGVSRDQFRGDLTFYFFFLNIALLTNLWVEKMLASDMLREAAIYAPFVILGSFLGVTMGNKLNERVFQKVIRIGLLGLIVLNIIKALS